MSSRQTCTGVALWATMQNDGGDGLGLSLSGVGMLTGGVVIGNSGALVGEETGTEDDWLESGSMGGSA